MYLKSNLTKKFCRGKLSTVHYANSVKKGEILSHFFECSIFTKNLISLTKILVREIFLFFWKKFVKTTFLLIRLKKLLKKRIRGKFRRKFRLCFCHQKNILWNQLAGWVFQWRSCFDESLAKKCWQRNSVIVTMFFFPVNLILYIQYLIKADSF